MSKTTAKLHYNKEKLVEEYQQTYTMFTKALLAGVGVVVVFFFILIAYLGGWSHTKAEPFANQFGERIELEYKGTKLPMFGGPDKPEKKDH